MNTGLVALGLVLLYAVCVYRLYLYTRPDRPPTRPSKNEEKKLVKEVESFLRDGE